jgi:hypothetical protein
MVERICKDGNEAVIAQSETSSWYRTKENDKEPQTSHFKPGTSQTQPKTIIS